MARWYWQSYGTYSASTSFEFNIPLNHVGRCYFTPTAKGKITIKATQYPRTNAGTYFGNLNLFLTDGSSFINSSVNEDMSAYENITANNIYKQTNQSITSNEFERTITYDMQKDQTYEINFCTNQPSHYNMPGKLEITYKTYKTFRLKYIYNDEIGRTNEVIIESTANSHTFIISTEIPKKENYKFKGWSKNSDCSTIDYQPGEWITTDFYTEIFAVWELDIITYTLNYDTVGSSSLFIPETIQGSPNEEQIFNISSITPILDNYTFDGWLNNSIIYPPGSSITVSQSDTTLTAQWREKFYWGNNSEYSQSDITADKMNTLINLIKILIPTATLSTVIKNNPVTAEHYNSIIDALNLSSGNTVNKEDKIEMSHWKTLQDRYNTSKYIINSEEGN